MSTKNFQNEESEKSTADNINSKTLPVKLLPKRVHAKKSTNFKFNSVSSLIGNSEIKKNNAMNCSEFTTLNTLILRDLKRMIEKKPSGDLSSVTTQYIGYIKKYCVIKEC